MLYIASKRVTSNKVRWGYTTMRGAITLVTASLVVLLFGDCTAQLKIDAAKSKNNNSTSKGKHFSILVFYLFIFFFRINLWIYSASDDSRNVVMMEAIESGLKVSTRVA